MKPGIKLFFTDFWPQFNKEDNFFTNLISKEYDIEITDNEPDYLIYSVFDNKFQRYNCTRIFFTGENTRPNFLECDYAFTFDHIENEPRHYRLPLYTLFGDVYKLLRKPPIDELLLNKTKFCNFVYSNPTPRKRNEFFKKLSKYKKVDSGGRVMNNLGIPVKDKHEFLKQYKFTIAFESESFPGYTTEKIFEPMLAGSVPIYWGNELVHKDFNTKSFLNYYDYGSDEALIERIIEVDRNDELYVEYLKQPYFTDNKVNQYVAQENIIEQFRYIFSKEIKPVSHSSKVFSMNMAERTISKLIIDSDFKVKKLLKKIRNFRFSKIRIKIDKFRKP